MKKAIRFELECPVLYCGTILNFDNKPKTIWQKIKFYFGICHLCGGKVQRNMTWHDAKCNKCGEKFEVTGL